MQLPPTLERGEGGLFVGVFKLGWQLWCLWGRLVQPLQFYQPLAFNLGWIRDLIVPGGPYLSI